MKIFKFSSILSRFCFVCILYIILVAFYIISRKKKMMMIKWRKKIERKKTKKKIRSVRFMVFHANDVLWERRRRQPTLKIKYFCWKHFVCIKSHFLSLSLYLSLALSLSLWVCECRFWRRCLLVFSVIIRCLCAVFWNPSIVTCICYLCTPNENRTDYKINTIESKDLSWFLR